jgi:hypothetical protein
MTRTTPSTKNRAKTAKKDSNRSLGLVLAVFSARGGTDTGNFTPNGEGWIEKALGSGG